VPTITAVGVAKPRAHGQDITMTEVAESKAYKKGSSLHCCSASDDSASDSADAIPELSSCIDVQIPYQQKKVIAARHRTTGAKMPATQSAYLQQKFHTREIHSLEKTEHDATHTSGQIDCSLLLNWGFSALSILNQLDNL